jgi:hypothetical protein
MKSMDGSAAHVGARLSLWLAVLGTLWASAAPAAGQTTTSPDDPLAGLDWLAGCWRLEAGDRVTDEQWMVPQAGLMMGMSRTVIGGRVRETERLVIRVVDGRVEYVADPSGQRETVFTALSTAGPEWVFSNEAHDFPQRIVYQPAGPGGFLARIEGEVDGQPRSADFPMERVACRPDP